jgi:UPF0755 protein
MRSRRSSCSFPAFVFLLLTALGMLAAALVVPIAAARTFGPPSPRLTAWQRFSFGLELIAGVDRLQVPRDPAGAEQLFVIEPGESVGSISTRLEAAGLIPSARTFRVYLVWAGLDTFVQTGTYRLSPTVPARQIADTIVSAGLTEVTFTVLAGWRMEEIAAVLPSSGLDITPESFLAAAAAPPPLTSLIPAGASAEGYLAPGRYLVPRAMTGEGLVALLVDQFGQELTAGMRSGFTGQGLSIHQAVTLASIIQREAVQDEEMPLIASVFYNRLAIGMGLQSDPTVQYALGFDASLGSWWTTPLSAGDYQIDSPYNTYRIPGLPPGPISNPGTAALLAAADPAESSYYFFQARCDGSGLHNFAETYEQHLQNNCP